MSAAGWSSGSMGGERLTWRDVLDIYKNRFQKLWRVLKFSLSATIIAVVAVILWPFIMTIGVLSAHFLFTAIVVSLALLISAWLYWKGLKLAFGREIR